MPPLTELTMFVLAAARAMGIFAAPGWIGAEVLPMQFRAALAAAIGLALTPGLLHRGLAVPDTAGGLVGGIAWNLALGLAFGFAISLLWSAAEMAGSIAELAVGLNPAGILGAGGSPSATKPRPDLSFNAGAAVLRRRRVRAVDPRARRQLCLGPAGGRPRRPAPASPWCLSSAGSSAWP